MTKNYDQMHKHKKKTAKRRKNINSTSGVTSEKKSSLMLVKVFICLFAVIVMLIIKLMLPDTMTAMEGSIKNWVSGNVNYKAAMSTLGEAMMGKKNVFIALPEAYSQAFGFIENEEAAQVINSDSSPEIDKHDIAAPSTDNSNAETEIIPETDIASKNGNNKQDKDYKDIFLDEQSAFSAYTLPEKVTYDMPSLDLELHLPVEGTVTSGFGYRNHPVEKNVLFHYGTDIGADRGDDIFAIADGTVLAVGNSVGYGNYLMIKHENNTVSNYAHCSDILVKQGESVNRGEPVAKVGDTGNATSACLHFELQIDDTYVNPQYYLSWN